MDTKIKYLIYSLDLTQETRNQIKLLNQKKIKNDEKRNVREWNKDLDYLMSIYHKEQNDQNVNNLLKFFGQKREQNKTTHSKNYRQHYQPPQKISPKVINLSNTFSIKHEIEILKLGISLTSTPNQNIYELETDIHSFTKRLRLTCHFCDSTYEDISIVKN